MNQPSSEHGKPEAPAGTQSVAPPAEVPTDFEDTQEFAATQADDRAANPSDWWSESADGQCSESAALFAASQPAPLSVV